MSQISRLQIELEIGDTGPHGVARDETGRSHCFSGWLELIALIESPSAEGPGAVDGSSPDAACSSTP